MWIPERALRRRIRTADVAKHRRIDIMMSDL